MSFTSWLRNLRSALVDRKYWRQLPLRVATHRPRAELLEDRCLLSFTPVVNYAAGTNPQAVLTADFNGDNRLDLAVANYSDSTVSVLLGNGNGTFATALTSATGDYPVSMAVGDFDADGNLDLVTVSYSELRVLAGNGNGTFQSPTSIGLVSNPTSVAVGDFNADGKMDLGVTSSVYYPGTPGTPGTPGYWIYYPGDYTYYQTPGTGGDWRPTFGYQVYHPGTPYTPDTPAHREGRVNVLLGHGDGSFALTGTQSLGETQPRSVAVGDFNKDGNLDLVATMSAYSPGFYTGYGGSPYGTSYYGGWSPGVRACVLLGNGDGTLQVATGTDVGSSPMSVAVGDVNGDGNLDLVTANGWSNDVIVVLGDGLGAFGAPQSFGAGNYPISVVLGDVTGDGKIDVATVNYYSNDLSVLRGLGDGSLAAPVHSAVGSSPVGVAAGDFNGDAFPDVAVANAGSNDVSVLLNTMDWNSFLVTTSSSTTAGEGLTVTVTAQDNVGNEFSGYAGTVHFSSSDAQAYLPADYTFTAADNGTHTFILGVTLKTTGTQSLTVTDILTLDLGARQGGIVVNAAAASTFDVSGFSSPRQVGAAGYFYVMPRDAFGNSIPTYTGTVHFTSSDPLATLPAPYTFTAADYGSHWFDVTFWTAGTQSLTATDTSRVTVTQGNIEVTTASKFVVSGFPSSATAGTAATFSVTALDIYGYLVPGYRGTVHFSSSDAAATLPGDFAFTNGVLNFTATLRTAGTQSLTVTDTLSPSITGSQAGIRVIPLASVTGPSVGFCNQTITFTLGASGMPAGTVSSYRIDWNGDGSVDQTVSGISGATVEHTYSAAGTYNIGVTATVHIGTQDYISNLAYKSVIVSVGSVSIQTDPADATKKALLVEGTANADLLLLSPGTGNSIAVSINGNSVGTFTAPGGVPFAHLLVYGYGGDDILRFSGGMTVPAFLFGGDGNDTLDAIVTTANNVLVGGAGVDVLAGGSGRDLLIGGLGSDSLLGGGGDDILIGGFTDYDANLAALCILMKEWGRIDADYNTRVKHLNGNLGGGLNGSYFLKATTVHTVNDDVASDNMWGQAGLDWFFTKKPPPNGTKDKVHDQSSGEVVTTIS